MRVDLTTTSVFYVVVRPLCFSRELIALTHLLRATRFAGRHPVSDSQNYHGRPAGRSAVYEPHFFQRKFACSGEARWMTLIDTLNAYQALRFVLWASLEASAPGRRVCQSWRMPEFEKHRTININNNWRARTTAPSVIYFA